MQGGSGGGDGLPVRKPPRGRRRVPAFQPRLSAAVAVRALCTEINYQWHIREKLKGWKSTGEFCGAGGSRAHTRACPVSPLSGQRFHRRRYPEAADIRKYNIVALFTRHNVYLYTYVQRVQQRR